MKQTKKLLKHIFGKKKEGLRYIKSLMDGDPHTPTLFAYSPDEGSASTDFARWLSEVTGNGAWVTEDQFYGADGFDESTPTIFVSEVSEVTDPFLMKLVKTRSPEHRIVVACRKYPQILRYVRDPSMLLVEIPPFNLEELRAEIGDVARKLS